jgi:SH3 domain protein
MKTFRLSLFVLLTLCFIDQSSAFNKAYVTDIFEITLRTGPSTENKILKLLSSGQELEVIEVQGDWSHVKVLENGEEKKEGWVLNRYLIHRVPYKHQLSSLERENKRLKEKLDPSEKQLMALINKEKELSGELQECQVAMDKLQKDFESLEKESSGYLKLKASNKETLSKLATTTKQFQELTEETEKLRTSQRNRWFITGALVLLCGFLIGIIIGRQSRKRRSSYY